METYHIIRNDLNSGTTIQSSGLTLKEAFVQTTELNAKESNSQVHYCYEVETSIPADVIGI